MSISNTPPADELFAVRAEIKELTAREHALKALMIADPSARTGNSYAAEVKEVKTTRTDIKELRKVYPDLVAEFTFTLSETRVEVRGISEDGEIFNLRRGVSRKAGDAAA